MGSSIKSQSIVDVGFVPLLSIMRTHTGCLRACFWQLPPTPRAPDPATTSRPPSLPFLPSEQQGASDSTCINSTSYFNLCPPLTGSSLFSPTSDAEPVKWTPAARGQEMYPITAAFIFMTQEAAGELGFSLSLNLF